METAAAALRWLQLASGLGVAGGLALALLAGPVRSPDALRWRGAVLRAAPWLVATWLAAAAALLILQVAVVGGRGAAVLEPSEWLRLLQRTRYGQVWQWRQAAALVLLLLLLARRPLMARLGERPFFVALLALALAIDAAAILSGHGAATEPLWLAAAAHALHLLGAALWAGGLPALAWGLHLAARGRDPLFRQLFAVLVRRFSRLAVACVAIVVASGSVLAYLQFGAPTRWPARSEDIVGGLLTVLERGFVPLLGTPYGLQVLAKLALLVAVLLLAAPVRWRWMPRLGDPAVDQGQVWRRAAVLVRSETALVMLILLFAAALIGTVPAAHVPNVWPLPFRLSVAATWEAPGVAISVASAALLMLGAGAWLGHGIRSNSATAVAWRRPRTVLAGLMLAAGLATILYALSVDAYPDTYRRSEVGYTATSVARGVALFSRHCVSCHGAGGKGDGPLAARLPAAPADLTAPHTALHTAGDIFWWLTHGKPNSAMPGFAHAMSEEERWDTVNFLRAFSAGYQARLLVPRIVPGQPWLAAPDFDFVTAAGTASALKEYRERAPVLLVFYSIPSSAERLAGLARLYPRLAARGAEVLAIALPGTDPHRVLQLPFPQAVDGAHEAAAAYLLFRRSLEDPGQGILDARPSHLEFLLDRFGYLRARWLPEQGPGGGWSDAAALLGEIERLDREPQILPPPDDHVH